MFTIIHDKLGLSTNLTWVLNIW